ncbi:MAG: PAS domain S-box protein, partial [Candidatus Neomarinimicrobiota bacterium]
ERREVLLQARAIRDEKGTLIASVSVQVDRTAVTRFEAALAESEARFRALAEYSAGAVFIVSGTAFTYVNPAFTTITGYTLEELEGKAFYDIIAPRFRDQVRERGLARQQGKDLPNRYTFAILRADGTERWVDFSAHATTFRGRPALVGSAFDITAYKQAQADLEQLTAELRQQVQLNDQLFRTTSDGYILADDQGWIVDVNPAYCQMIGYSRAELTQMNINQLEGKLTQEQIDARIEQMVRDQRAHFTTRHRTKTGKMIDLDVSVTVLSSPGGPLVAAFVRDITERLQLEKALRRNIRSLETTLNQLQLLIASSSVLFSATLDDMAQAVMQSLDALFRLDFGALLLLNPERTRLTPLAAVSRPARGQPLQDDRKWLRPKRLTPQRGIIGWVATHGESVRSGDVTRDDRFLAVREGIGSELCVPLKTPDELKGVLAIGSRKKRAFTRRDQDILEALANQLALAVQNRTTLDQLEELNRYLEQRIEERTEELHRKNLDLLQTQEALVDMVKQLNQSSRKLEASLKRLQAANQELEAFSYSVSHDLRAPLRAITGFARILEEDYRDQLDAEGLRLLEVIQSSADQMGQLIDDLLTLSRLGRKHLEIVRVPCAELVQACIEEVSRDFPDLKVEWKIGRLPTVVGDRNLLKQVWLNLLHNAVKFSSKSDHPKVQVRVREEEVRYVFTIRDWGAGFDPRYADKLFQVFQRLHSSQDFPGTGVGLSIVKQILLRHGGEIWAKSKPNQGAAFTFTLLKDGPPQLDPGYNL